jgi:hypothetical protein
VLDINDFVFTTEAHLLPLTLTRLSNRTVMPVSVLSPRGQLATGQLADGQLVTTPSWPVQLAAVRVDQQPEQQRLLPVVDSGHDGATHIPLLPPGVVQSR